MPYAGDLNPTDAYRVLADDPDAVLVDVRTAAEWTYVGVPDLRGLGKHLVQVEWQRYGGVANDSFVDDLTAAGVRPDQSVLLLCRSGVRSVAAANALAERGFSKAYNVTDGFEGPMDDAGHRGGAAGWKASALPWRQS